MEFPPPNPQEPRRDIPATVPPSAASTPAPDPAARFRKPEPAPAPAPAPARGGLPGPVWFVLGAAVASAAWYGYGLMQRAMVKSMAGALTASGPAELQAGTVDPTVVKFLEEARAAANQMSAAAGSPPPATSSLDFVSGPLGSAAGTPQSGQIATPVPQAQINAVGQAGANMVESILPLIANPGVLKGLSPDKQRELQGLTAALMQMQDSLRTGKPINRNAQAEIFQALQKMQAEAAAQSKMQPMPAPKGERR